MSKYSILKVSIAGSCVGLRYVQARMATQRKRRGESAGRSYYHIAAHGQPRRLCPSEARLVASTPTRDGDPPVLDLHEVDDPGARPEEDELHDGVVERVVRARQEVNVPRRKDGEVQRLRPERDAADGARLVDLLDQDEDCGCARCETQCYLSARVADVSAPVPGSAGTCRRAGPAGAFKD